MKRLSRCNPAELERALATAARAQTVEQLRQCQAILIPALTGGSLAVTAQILGLSGGRVAVLRRQFRAGGALSVLSTAKRGGRRHALLSLQQEINLLGPWLPLIQNGKELKVADIHIAYQHSVGRKVPKSTIYRLLARHGWHSSQGRSSPSL